MKLIQLIPIAAFAALPLASCQETASDPAKDVAAAREEAAEDLGEAYKDANKEVATARADVADVKS